MPLEAKNPAATWAPFPPPHMVTWRGFQPSLAALKRACSALACATDRVILLQLYCCLLSAVPKKRESGMCLSLLCYACTSEYQLPAAPILQTKQQNQPQDGDAEGELLWVTFEGVEQTRRCVSLGISGAGEQTANKKNAREFHQC